MGLLTNAKSVVLMVPSKPFFDEVAGALGLYLSLKNSKDVRVVCPTPMTVEYNRLVGIDKITSSLNMGGGVGNLVIQFEGYDASKIDRVSYDVDGSTFKLTVIPKAGNQSPTQNQVHLSGGEVSTQEPDLVVLIGGDDPNHFPLINPNNPPTAKLVHIGIKMLDKVGSLPVTSFAKPASSVSELVTGYIKEMQLPIDKDIATNLLGGIEAHTQSFIAGMVTPVTFETAADLIKLGGVRGGAFVPPAQGQGQPNPMAQAMQNPVQSTQPMPTQTIPSTNDTPFSYQPMSTPAPIDVPADPYGSAYQQPVGQVAPQPQASAQPIQGQVQDPVNPPSDWLNPKIYTGTNVN